MPAINKGKILQLQDFSVNDGEGIRTVVFFAGCSLRCKWCANPEGYITKNQIMYIPSLCSGCGRCMAVCPVGAGIDLSANDARDKCTACGLCVSACLDKARRNTVAEYTVAEVMDHLATQLPYFRASGGGVTYSGGECTAQPEFLADAVAAAYDMGLNQALETSGTFDFALLQPVLEQIDLLFMDIKHFDSSQHRQYTGCGNEQILENIARLGRLRGNIVIRIPVIMGVNGDDGNILATARFISNNLKEPKLELLPYHAYGADKYAQLGMEYQTERFRTPTEQELSHMCSLAASTGVEIVSYR